MYLENLKWVWWHLDPRILTSTVLQMLLPKDTGIWILFNFLQGVSLIELIKASFVTELYVFELQFLCFCTRSSCVSMLDRLLPKMTIYAEKAWPDSQLIVSFLDFILMVGQIERLEGQFNYVKESSSFSEVRFKTFCLSLKTRSLPSCWHFRLCMQ